VEPKGDWDALHIIDDGLFLIRDCQPLSALAGAGSGAASGIAKSHAV